MRIVHAHEINIVQDIARACSVDPQYRTSTCDIVCAHKINIVQYLVRMQDIPCACSVDPQYRTSTCDIVRAHKILHDIADELCNIVRAI